MVIIRSETDANRVKELPDHIGKGTYNESLDEGTRFYDGGCDKHVVAPIS